MPLLRLLLLLLLLLLPLLPLLLSSWSWGSRKEWELVWDALIYLFILLMFTLYGSFWCTRCGMVW